MIRPSHRRLRAVQHAADIAADEVRMVAPWNGTVQFDANRWPASPRDRTILSVTYTLLWRFAKRELFANPPCDIVVPASRCAFGTDCDTNDTEPS
jgi:hypothetical protein